MKHPWMNWRGIASLFLIATLWSPGLTQSRTQVRQFTERDGLSYRWVFDIIQDHRGFLWFATYDGLNRYDGQNFVTYKHADNDSNTISHNDVRHVAEDANGNIWTYGMDLVFNRIDLSTGMVTRTTDFYKEGVASSVPDGVLRQWAVVSNGDFVLLMQEEGRNACTFWKYTADLNGFEFIVRIPTKQVVVPGFSERSDGKVWLWGMGAGYYLVDLESGEVREYPVNTTGKILESQVSVPIDQDNNFWYPSDSILSDAVGTLNKFKLPDGFTGDDVRRIRLDNNSDIWINLGDSTLYCFRVDEQTLEKFTNPFFGESDDKRAMQRFYTDREGAHWVGHFYGAARIVNRASLFKSYLLNSEASRRPEEQELSARDIVQSDSHTLIVRAEGHKLYKIDIPTGVISELIRRPLSDRVRPDLEGIFSMFMADGYLWTNQANYLVRTDPITGFYEVFDGPPISNDDFRRIFRDKAGRIWWCCTAGIYLFDKFGGNMVELELTGADSAVVRNFMYASYDSVDDKIYASYQYGICEIDCSDQSVSGIEVFGQGEGDYLVMAILKWRGEFWLSTDKGLVRFNPASGERKIYARRDGLPSDLVYSAIGTGSDLWLATHNGLCQFNPETMRIATYYEEQGLPNNEFNRWSYLKTAQGDLYFGGLNGVVGFDPGDFTIAEERTGKLNLLQVLKYDQQGKEAIGIVTNPYSVPDEVIVSPYERTLLFKYALALYDDVAKNQFLHQLEGLEHEWIHDGDLNETRYIQVPPGQYTFRVRALGPNGTPALNEIAIPITVMQYWYLRWWAILGYIIITAVCIAALYRIQMSRKLDRQEARRIRELEAVKSRMYTNITHEFRTPLTVMLGMNQSVSEYAERGDLASVHHATEMIDRNARSLLDLVNQMLDLSRLESGMMDVHNEHADVIAYLRYRLEAFQSFAAEKRIQIGFKTQEDEILMDFDPERLSHIINNLVSNAIKFTPEDGTIQVSAEVAVDQDQRFLRLVVKDSGIGIEADQLPLIFDRFYQADGISLKKGEGTGIGLSLVKEMVRLLGGSIEVRSTPGEGAEFTVLLPITERALPKAGVNVTGHAEELLVPDVDKSEETEELPLVLIVEDNADVMHYIRLSLGQQYRTITAADGREGIEKAVEHIPDLVISDVMMPDTDGYRLCRAIKSDERTSHIPVILLTAKTDHDSKVEGLEHGADAYLAKPFDRKELLIRLRNLLALRAEMQRYYSGGTRAAGTTEGTGAEDAYLAKVKHLISEHLEEEDFDVVRLSQLMHVSRAQLHRKLTALTGHSASHIIRLVQLEKATGLLINSDLSVSEIAYQSGFRTQAHFSRVFSDTYGSSPSEFRKKPSIPGSET